MSYWVNLHLAQFVQYIQCSPHLASLIPTMQGCFVRVLHWYLSQDALESFGDGKLQQIAQGVATVLLNVATGRPGALKRPWEVWDPNQGIGLTVITCVMGLCVQKQKYVLQHTTISCSAAGGDNFFCYGALMCARDVMVFPSAWLRKVEGEVFEDSVTSSKVFYIFIDCRMIYRNLKMDAS